MPPPSEVRALIVGIDSYPGLGAAFDVPGAAAGAVAFAKWLISERGVDPAHVDLWLSPRSGKPATDLCQEAGLVGVAPKPFDWGKFRQAMAAPAGYFVDGTFLMVYFCGHGVVSGARGEQYLVLPQATKSQFNCFEVTNWRELFKGPGWSHFGWQLWLVDACKNKWGVNMDPVVDSWNPGNTAGVRQCAMFACSTGESASIDSQYGPRFTRELLKQLGSSATGDWPDFVLALRGTAAQVRVDSQGAQSPSIAIGEDWYGVPFLVTDDLTIGLFGLLNAIPWPTSRFLPYAAKAQRSSQTGMTLPDDLEGLLALLNESPSTAGVPPLLDFAERVARAVDLPKLRVWIDSVLTPQQKAELKNRLQESAGHARLSLWYRDDGPTPCIEGDLDVLDAGSGIRAWQRKPAKPVTPDTVEATIGRWLSDVYDHAKGQKLDLVIDLYMPRKLLTNCTYDTATVRLDAENEMRLGEDHAALLRCTDRYKALTKRTRWEKLGPKILSRLTEGGVVPLRWATAADTAQSLKGAFVPEGVASPVWLGFDPSLCGGGLPLDAALENGLPAVIWLHAELSTDALKALDLGLQTLLSSALDEFPARLIEWRSTQPSDPGQSVSFLLDDPARMPALWASWTQPGV